MYGKKATSLLPKGYIVTRHIGSGAYGSIWKLCDQDSYSDCKYAVKVEQVDHIPEPKSYDQLRYEYKMQRNFYCNGLGVEPIKHKMFKRGKTTYSMIVMCRMDGTMEDLLTTERTSDEIDILYRKMKAILKRLKRHHMTHGDFHVGNLGYTQEIVNHTFQPVFYPLDFQWSTDKGHYEDIDLYQLYRSLSLYPMDIHPKNAKRLIKRIRADLRKAGYSTTELLTRNINDVFDDMHDDYWNRCGPI